MATTIFQISAAGALPRTDWLEVDSGTGGGTSGKIAILHQACSALSAGNPTPDTATFPPADYPPGSLFLPTSYPAAQDNGTGQVTTYHAGDMIFRRTGGAGAEVWTWFGGSFRASNANGNYQRDADGKQQCDHEVNVSLSAVVEASATWTYPATFVATPTPNATALDANAVRYNTGVANRLTSSAAVWVRHTDGTSTTATIPVGVHARGEWQ
jgi:hypothetical protein